MNCTCIQFILSVVSMHVYYSKCTVWICRHERLIVKPKVLNKLNSACYIHSCWGIGEWGTWNGERGIRNGERGTGNGERGMRESGNLDLIKST